MFTHFPCNWAARRETFRCKKWYRRL